MTIRWKPGKEPTTDDVANVITNALPHFSLSADDVQKIAAAVVRLYKSRIEGRR